jgi:asparagine synthase (glutamine-hydrolysing)
MCGIAGGIGFSAPSKVILNAQLEAMKHRGPDDSGTFHSGGISLGMCRLAIVEIATSSQPHIDASGLVRIVWNGEIFNYLELKEELEKNGVTCRSSSESEILVNLYLTFGISFVKKLNGMFAIALFDDRDFSLHLIRDRLGKKPLWVSKTNDNSLLFSSEIRALHCALPKKTVRTEMVAEVMQFAYVSSPNSSYEEINQVPPASVMTWVNGKVSTTIYWKPDFFNTIEVTYDEAVEQSRTLIEDAVKRRLISERPIGSFLSGGFDSTIVTALMVQNSSHDVKTFSIGFEDPKYNEANFAYKIAAFLGTDHHTEYVKPDPTLVLEKITQVLDQPLADSSIIPTYLLSEFASRDITVALGGDGGDEVFGGYDRYLATPILQSLNPLLGATEMGLRLIGSPFLSRNRKWTRIQAQLKNYPSFSERYKSIMSLGQQNELSQFLNKDFCNDIADRIFENSFQQDDISLKRRMFRSDILGYLPGDLLHKADAATMANSLELRSPFLDVEVVEWGLSLPDSFKVKGLETKRILKDIARSLVPTELVDRPKRGFGIPRSDWLRGGLYEMTSDVLLSATSKSRGWFDTKAVEKAITSHKAGFDQDHLLWPALILELWAITWLDN